MNSKAIKTMIFGVQIMLLGGFTWLDPSTGSFGAIGFFVALGGLLIGVFGFLRED